MAFSYRLAAAFLLAHCVSSLRPSQQHTAFNMVELERSSDHATAAHLAGSTLQNKFFSEFLGLTFLVASLAAVVLVVGWGLGGVEFEEGRQCHSQPCCRWCLVVLGVLLVNVSWVLLRVGTAECTIDSFDASLILPENAVAAGIPEKFDRATVQNTPSLDSLDLDLFGVWWMDGNPLPQEQLISFAGATGPATFPASLKVPFGMSKRWTWSDNFLGRAVVFYYALTSTPDEPNQFDFTSNSSALIVPVGDVFGKNLFGFENINADEWDRVNDYTLRRVINGDGTKGPFWDKFMEWYPSKFRNGRVIVQASDSQCKRKCQYFLLCSMCNMIC